MSKDDAVTLLLAENLGLIKLEPERRHDAMHAMNNAVLDIDRASLAAAAAHLPSLQEAAATGSLGKAEAAARQVAAIAEALKAAEERHREAHRRLNRGEDARVVVGHVVLDGAMLAMGNASGPPPAA